MISHFNGQCFDANNLNIVHTCETDLESKACRLLFHFEIIGT